MSPSVFTDVPDQITYQGRLLFNGLPVTSATDIRFKLYDGAAGTERWSEDHTITPDSDGIYTVVMGETIAIPDDYDELWLELILDPTGTPTTLSPRKKLTSSPFVLRAGELPDLYVSGNVGIGNPAPDTRLSVSGDIALNYGASLMTTATLHNERRILTTGWHSSVGDCLDFFVPGDGNPTTYRLRITEGGSIYQRGSLIHADYVFESDYELESIDEHAKYMWKNKHLKGIPKATRDETGQEILEIGTHRRGIVEELEKAHIYIELLHKNIKSLEEKLVHGKKLEKRIAKLESALNDDQ